MDKAHESDVQTLGRSNGLESIKKRRRKKRRESYKKVADRYSHAHVQQGVKQLCLVSVKEKTRGTPRESNNNYKF